MHLGRAFACALTIATVSICARAQVPVTSSPIAEALFQEGRELLKQERYNEACPKLEESQRIEPMLGTLLHLALCHEGQGRIATAWAEFTSALSIAEREKQTERADLAREHIAALTPRLTRVKLVIQNPPLGLSLTLDGRITEVSVAGVAVPVDPGEHRLEARAPGKQPWATSFRVPAETNPIVIPIPQLQDAATPLPPVVPVAPIPEPALRPVAPAEKAAPKTNYRPMMWTGFAIGGAGILVGTITGVVVLTRAGELKQACAVKCPTAEDTSRLSSTNTIANISNVSFVIGGLGAAIGIVGLALTPSSSARRGRLEPLLGPGAVGMHGSF